MTKRERRDFSHRFGFLVNEVGRLYGRRFDQLARERLGLSRAQCRILGALASHDGDEPLSQAALAERLDLTPMGVGSLVDRMEAAGWVRRIAHPTDRRVNGIELQAQAREALEGAKRVSDEVQAAALEGFAAADRAQLIALLRRAHANLSEAAPR